jgi:hypothetical protein
MSVGLKKWGVAVYRSPSDGRLFIDNEIFPDEDTARQVLGALFVRLAYSFEDLRFEDPKLTPVLKSKSYKGKR